MCYAYVVDSSQPVQVNGRPGGSSLCGHSPANKNVHEHKIPLS